MSGRPFEPGPRVRSVETLVLSRRHEPAREWFTMDFRAVKADCALVRVETEDGHVGVAEACAYGDPPEIADCVAWLARAIVGLPLHEAWGYATPTGRARTYDCTVAGLDGAFWDLAGQLAGRRVADLLTPDGAAREAVELYASGGCRYSWRHRPEQLVDEVLGYADAGFRTAKVRIGTEWRWDNVTPERFLALMAELRAAAADRIALAVDGNQRLDRAQARRVADGLDALGFAWFEEPLPQDDVEGYAELNAAVGLPITGGEQVTTLEAARPLLERRAVEVIQPDAAWCGISETMRIARLAATYGIDVMPHSWHNGAMALANAHVLAALPQARPLEICMVQGPLQWDVLAQPPAIEDGRLLLADRPGLGTAPPEDLEERYPWVPGSWLVRVDGPPEAAAA